MARRGTAAKKVVKNMSDPHMLSGLKVVAKSHLILRIVANSPT
jgi:hypothetical protein